MFVLLIAASFTTAVAHPNTNTIRTRLQAVVDAQTARYNMSFSVAVTVAGGETVTAVAGMKNYIKGERMDAFARIPMGSATKLYTAVAALQAAERGELDLDAPIGPLLEPILQAETQQTLEQLWGAANASIVRGITTRQLLSMRSGIPDYDDGAMEAWTLNISNIYKDITPPEYVTDWTPKGFLFAPDSGGSYSSNSFVLAGYVVAALAGAKSWDGFRQRSILDAQPALAAAAPGFDFAGRGPCFSIPNTTSLYFEVPLPVTPYWTTFEFVDSSFQSCLSGWTCGNIVATPGDTSKVLYHVFSEHSATPLLNASSRAQMVAARPLTVGWSEGLMYGLGTMVTELYSTPGVDPKYTSFVGHGGAEYASSADLHYYNAALDFTIVAGTTSQYGMNCDNRNMPDVTDNQYAKADTDCRLVAAVVDVLTNGTQLLVCPTFGTAPDTAAPVAVVAATAAATAAAARTRRRSGAGAGHAALSARHGGGGGGAAATGEEDSATASLAASLAAVAISAPLEAGPLSNQGACVLPGPLYGMYTCVGSSAALNATDCAVWKALFSMTNGPHWSRCNTLFADPCACDGVECSPSGQGGNMKLTAVNMSGANLRGDVGYPLGLLPTLDRLILVDVSDNLLYGAVTDNMTAVFPSFVGGCSLAENPLACPLPGGAQACHRADQPAPKCIDPTLPRNITAACAVAGKAINSDPTIAAANAAASAISNSLYGDGMKACDGELQVNRTCHMNFGEWTGLSPELDAFMSGFRANLTAVAPTALLCFINAHITENVAGIGKADVYMRGALPYAVAPEPNCTEGDAYSYLNWLGNAQHVAQAGYYGVKYEWQQAECYLNGTRVSPRHELQ
eukprot:g8217.t1